MIYIGPLVKIWSDKPGYLNNLPGALQYLTKENEHAILGLNQKYCLRKAHFSSSDNISFVLSDMDREMRQIENNSFQFLHELRNSNCQWTFGAYWGVVTY
jgi:hypothetical protein